MKGTETKPNESITSTEPTQTIEPEPSKLIIEITNLGPESTKTVKRDLKEVIEKYAWSHLVSGCVNVKEGE